jgi:hypothetical protein
MGGDAGLAAHAVRQERNPAPMVTTNRLIPIDAIGLDPPEPVHLTGLVQMLTRVTMGDTHDRPVHIELYLDAARVRGLGLQNGTRYQARGAYRLVDDLKESAVPFELIGSFELFRHGTGDAHPGRLLLIVPIHVTVQADGKVTATLDSPKLLSCPAE